MRTNSRSRKIANIGKGPELLERNIRGVRGRASIRAWEEECWTPWKYVRVERHQRLHRRWLLNIVTYRTHQSRMLSGAMHARPLWLWAGR
jgi:hypothetical protein